MFTPLRVRSHFSFLWGTASPAALAARAAALGYRSLALTDRDSMAGAVTFLDEAGRHGLRPILGAEIPDGPLLLLAIDARGYGTVCRVVSARMLEDDFDPLRSLADGAPGTHVVCGTPALAERLRAAVPPDRLWLDVPAAGARPVPPIRLRAAGRRLGIGLLATGAVSLGALGEHEVHRVLRAAAERCVLPDIGAGRGARPGEVLRPPGAAARAWQDLPEALANNRRVADGCRVTLPCGSPIFPTAPLPPGADARDHLRRQCLAGLRRRRPRRPRLARERLDHELEVIARLGFTEYFLIVGDIVRAARASGIPTVGRGSGASSIVAWALGITNVDPIEYGLTFERFLHDRRADCPDLDIDLCWRGRDEVLDHVYRTYGRDRVAMISTHVLFHPRSAFREVARACGWPTGRVDRMSRVLPGTYDDESLAERLRRDPVAARLVPVADPEVRRVLALAGRLEGLPRHLGIHSGGIVIADGRLTDYTALQRATKGIVVTQYEMRAIEKIGLVKIDLLGNRALSTVRETARLVARTRGVRLGLDRVPRADPVTARLLRAGDTLGSFQIESPGMRNLLRQLRPARLDGVIAALSLIRPGPAGSGMKDLYVLRARGREEVAYGDPRLEPILRENHGVLLYEEDVMKVTAALCGVPLSDADGVRRAIGKARARDEWEALEKWFVARATANGCAPAAARSVWESLARFGAYAFCKAHASGYGVLAYWTTWLKAHYPAEFAVAILNNHQGMYPKRVHLEDARRRGVRVRGPCVQRSAAEFTVEDGAIRVGLGEVAGLSGPAIESVLEARGARPFASLADLVRRTWLARPEATALVRCGACDVFGENRPRLLWRLGASFCGETAHRGDDAPFLFDPERFRADAPAPELPGLDEAARMAAERELLGFPIERHPVAPLRGELRREGVVPAARLASRAGQAALVAGLVSARRRVRTRRGETMLFLTLEDETGLAEVTLFPEAYRRFGGRARGGGILVVGGRVEDHLGAITLTAELLHPAPEAPRGVSARAGASRCRAGDSRPGSPSARGPRGRSRAESPR